MEYKIKVYSSQEQTGQGYELVKQFTVDASTGGKARKQARAELSRSFEVRAINICAEEDRTIIAYVAPLREPASKPKPGKPVIHTGVVGRGREIRRRG